MSGRPAGRGDLARARGARAQAALGVREQGGMQQRGPDQAVRREAGDPVQRRPGVELAGGVGPPGEDPGQHHGGGGQQGQSQGGGNSQGSGYGGGGVPDDEIPFAPQVL